MPRLSFRDRKVGQTVLMRALMGAALGAFVIGSQTTAARADDDGPSVIGSIMNALGFKGADSHYDGIDYNERSPLVVPPTKDLPAPANANAAPAPNWPKDQDVERRKKAKAEDKKIAPHPDYVSESSRPLRPNELDRPGVPKGNAAGDGDYTANSSMVDPRDRGVTKGLFSAMFRKKEEFTTFTGEPTRETLTDPPPGYLTPSPDQPYGVGVAPTQYKVQTLGERVEPQR
jgi:hypothetical protein